VRQIVRSVNSIGFGIHLLDVNAPNAAANLGGQVSSANSEGVEVESYGCP
jgi:hypothetical protein